MMISCLAYTTTMYSVTAVKRVFFFCFISIYPYVAAIISTKVLRSSNCVCHNNVSSTAVTTLIANTVLLPLVCDVSIKSGGCCTRQYCNICQ